MARGERYNTKQKDTIFNLIESQKREFTVKDIYNQIKEEAGLTTIYRLIDKLVRDGLLVKNIGDDNVTYYQYLKECSNSNHFYLKCESCGNMIHVDCDCIESLASHIFKRHKFKPSREHIIINGICEDCSNKGESA